MIDSILMAISKVPHQRLGKLKLQQKYIEQTFNELELCEEEVAGQFFDSDAEGFVNTYYPYICHIRREWHNSEQYKKVTQFYSPKLTCLHRLQI